MQASDELFRPLDRKTVNMQEEAGTSLPFRETAWQRLRRNRAAVFGMCVIGVVLLLAVFGPLVSPYSYSGLVRGDESQWPSWKHLMGTDALGRDLFVRVLYGARISLSVGLAAALINLTIGVLYGGISGYFGGRTDNIMMRVVDILYSIPPILYIILLSVTLKNSLNEWFKLPVLSMFRAAGPALVSTYIAVGLAYWVDMARIVRGQVLSLKEQEYVAAARVLGAGSFRIILRHLVPNCAGAVLVTTMLQIPTAIFTEAFLSFIGLGVDAPMASWGSLASDAAGSIRSYPYLLLFPSLAICITVLAFNLLGDGLRDALDPGMKK